MRTQTIVVLDSSTGAVYCNDPDAVLVHTGGEGEPTIEECGCCGSYHLSTSGAVDCRDDNHRLVEIVDGGEIADVVPRHVAKR